MPAAPHSKACGPTIRLRQSHVYACDEAIHMPAASLSIASDGGKAIQLPPFSGSLLAPASTKYFPRPVCLALTSINMLCDHSPSCPRYSLWIPCQTATPSAFTLLGSWMCLRSLLQPPPPKKTTGRMNRNRAEVCDGSRKPQRRTDNNALPPLPQPLLQVSV